jgi:hypothetical protein
MTRTRRAPLHHRLAALLLCLASGPMAFLALERSAHAADAADANEAPAARPVPAAPARVGDATAGMLALQRDGTAASPVARPVPGEVAARNYQRYLKSFDYPIPDRYGSSTTGGSGGGASSSAGAAR